MYNLLKELYPNMKDTILMLIAESSIDLIAAENANITFPLESVPLIKEDTEGCIVNDEWRWEVNLN